MTVAEQTKTMSKVERTQVFEQLLHRAAKAGFLAAEQAVPIPMVVTGQAPGEEPQAWYVAEGPCGFAWVTLHPATTAFARYLKATRFNCPRWLSEKEGGHWGTAYQGGYQLWVWVGGQSMARKEAYARAFASVLREAGYQAYAGSRMD